MPVVAMCIRVRRAVCCLLALSMGFADAISTNAQRDVAHGRAWLGCAVHSRVALRCRPRRPKLGLDWPPMGIERRAKARV